MIKNITLEKEDLAHMHDVIYDVIDREPTDEEILRVWNALPEHIRGDAIQWGCDDTVFRDNMYVWLKKNLPTVNLP